jgi:Leucine-rich repeat (LRR) protein
MHHINHFGGMMNSLKKALVFSMVIFFVNSVWAFSLPEEEKAFYKDLCDQNKEYIANNPSFKLMCDVVQSENITNGKYAATLYHYIMAGKKDPLTGPNGEVIDSSQIQLYIVIEHHSTTSFTLSGSLKVLPESFRNLKHINWLYLQDVQITDAVAAAIGDLTHLHDLYVCNTELPSSFFTEIADSKRLRSLSLWNVPDASISSEIGKMQHIRELTIGAKQINNLPNELIDLKNLIDLTVTNSGSPAIVSQEVYDLLKKIEEQGIFIPNYYRVRNLSSN